MKFNNFGQAAAVTPIISFIFLSLVCLFLGQSVVLSPSPHMPLIFVVAVFVFFVAFVRTDLALMFLVFAMLLSPEIPVASISPRRDVVIRFEDLLIIVFFMAWLAKMAVNRSLPLITATPINHAIGLYVLAFILSTLKGMIVGQVSPLNGTFYVLKYLEYFIIFYLVANNLFIRQDKKQVMMYITAFLITFAIVNIFAISQIGISGRVSAPFEGDVGEPNTLGGYQLILISVCLGFLLHARSIIFKFILMGLLGLTIAPFLFTLSRSSYMSFFPMYLIFIFTHKSKRFLLVVCGLFVILASIFLLPQKVYDRIAYTFKPQVTQTGNPVTLLGIKFGPSASERLTSWMVIGIRWLQSPYFGRGVTGAGFIDGQYFRTLIELGFIGFGAFVYMLYSIHRWSVRIYRSLEDPYYKGLALGFVGANAAMITHSFTANTFIIVRIMEPYWFLLAIVMMLPVLEKKQLLKRDRNKDHLDDAVLGYMPN